MPDLRRTVLSLRYSSWSMRPWLVLKQAGADFTTETVELESFSETTLAAFAVYDDYIRELGGDPAAALREPR